MGFTLVWSVGGSCDNKGRQLFSDTLWKHLEEKGIKVEGEGLPADAFWYDYIYEFDGDNAGHWTPWLTWAPHYTVPPRQEYQNIVVPTGESIRLTYTFQTLIV